MTQSYRRPDCLSIAKSAENIALSVLVAGMIVSRHRRMVLWWTGHHQQHQQRNWLSGQEATNHYAVPETEQYIRIVLARVAKQ